MSGRERRASARFATKVTASLASSRGSKRAVEITDLSSQGCSTDLGARGWLDQAGYSIKFAGLETLGAELRWTGGAEAGFRFDRPLHPAVLDHVLRANPPASEQDGVRETEGAVPPTPRKEVR